MYDHQTKERKQNINRFHLRKSGHKTAPELLEFLQGAMPGVEELVLDLAEVEYVSSAGLRVILFAQKTMTSQGSMKVANVNSDIMETFELTGFTDILTII